MIKMKIGIVTLSRIDSNQGVYYNLQDFGLAKAFAFAGHSVVLYRLAKNEDKIEEINSIKIIFKKTFGLGKQSITGFKFIDKDLDRLVCFSDNQISFPRLYHWCRKYNVILQPYIGVLKSNSNNIFIAFITDILLKRNISLYKKIMVYGKTPSILKEFDKLGIKKYKLIPVCLDDELLHSNYEKKDRVQLRTEYGYEAEDKILLFIGRMEKEKEPFKMLEIFNHLFNYNSKCRLIMIGDGILYQCVEKEIKARGLTENVQLIRRVPNQEIWKFYCICNCFVNLNQHEIYGMSILEAMYYQCPVVAVRASGPEYIMEDGVGGYLCDDMEEIYFRISQVLTNNIVFKNTRQKVEQNFYWINVINWF